MIYKQGEIWCVETRNTGYYIAPRGPLAEQLHYGRKIRPELQPLQQKISVCFGTDVIYDKAVDPSLSLLHLGLELSPTEKGDFRQGALALRSENGDPVFDFRYLEGEILSQPPICTDLPQAHGAKECLVLRFSSPQGMRAELYYTPYEECDTIVRHMRLINETHSCVTLHRAMSFQLDLPRQDLTLTTLTGAWAREFCPQTTALRRGITCFGSTCGTSSHFCNPFFLLSDPQACEKDGEVYGFNLIYSGSHRGSVELDSYGMTRVMSGIQPDGFAWTLEHGEFFDTPQAVLSFSDQGRNGMRQNMHRFVRAHIVPDQWRERERPILVNNWEATYFDFNQKKLVSLAKKASELGVELFVLDDGWFGRRTDDTRGLGDFDVNLQKLPNGLSGLAEYLGKRNLNFGLWVEPEMVCMDSALYEQHPDWIVASPSCSPSFSRNQLVLDLCRREVQDYLIEQLSQILSSAPIRYVKWDMNRHHSDRYSASLLEQGRFSHAWILGLYRVLKSVTQSHSDVLFEGCASGGNRFDLGILCYMPQIWLSDDTDAWERCKMQTWASLGYPQSVMGCHVTAVPNHQTLRSSPLESRFDVAAFGLLGYEMDLTQVTPVQEKAIREQIAFYKEHRTLFQQGQLLCLMAPTPEKGGAWIVVSEDKQQAAVLEMNGLLTPNSAQPPLRLQGLDPDICYQVCVRAQGLELSSFRSLLNHVLPVRVKGDGLLVHLADGLYQMPCEQICYTAQGDLLMHAGIRRPQMFSGTGYNEGVRPMPDFSARIWLLTALNSEE